MAKQKKEGDSMGLHQNKNQRKRERMEVSNTKKLYKWDNDGDGLKERE